MVFEKAYGGKGLALESVVKIGGAERARDSVLAPLWRAFSA